MARSNAVLKGVSSEELEGALSSYQEDLDPLEYAKAYSLSCYPEDSLYHDEQLILDFLIEHQAAYKDGFSVLDIGSASVIPYALALSRRAGSVHMADISPVHLELVSQWVQRLPAARSWRVHTDYILEAENRILSFQYPVNDIVIELRENAFRKILGTLVQGDLCAERPLRISKTYDAVTCFYAAEPAVGAWAKKLGGASPQGIIIQDLWTQVIKNLCSLVAPSGGLFLSVICNSDFYVIKDLDGRPQKINIANINSKFLEETLRQCNMKIEAVQEFRPIGLEEEGMSDVSLIHARRLD